MLLSKPHSFEDECKVSYLIRVSDSNGFKHIGHLLRYAGLQWKNNRAPIHQILTGEYELTKYLSNLGMTECQSKVEQTYRYFKRVVDTPYLLVKYPKVCPECIAELEYCKYEWSFLPLLACTRHKKMLIDVHRGTGKRLSWYRQHLNKFDGAEVIEADNGNALSAAIQISQYVEGILSGRKINVSAPVILHGLEFRESLSLIHFIGHYQARLLGGSFKPVSMENRELGQHYQNVWKVLHNWPDSFYELLSQYIDRPMSSKGIGGLNKHYRDLYEHLHRQQANQGVARIKAEFDRYIEVYWPGVLEPDRITRIHLSSPTRNIISKNEAARLIGSRLSRIDNLVQQEKLTPVIFKGKAHYLRGEVEALAAAIASNWTMVEACEALQLTRYQLKQLLDKGVLRALQRPGYLNRDWVIDKKQCQELVECLRIKARKTWHHAGTVSMVGIQRQGYSVVELVSAMQAGKLEYGVKQDMDHPVSFKQFVAFKINMMK